MLWLKDVCAIFASPYYVHSLCLNVTPHDTCTLVNYACGERNVGKYNVVHGNTVPLHEFSSFKIIMHNSAHTGLNYFI